MIGPRIGTAIGTRIGIAVGISADPLVMDAQPASMVGLDGDSNGAGIGVANAADRDFAVMTPNPLVKLNAHYATSVGAGASNTFIDYPSADAVTDLSLYADPGGASMGFEMSLGTTLVRRGVPLPVIQKVCVVGSTLAVEWNPAGTYPAAGSGNLFHISVTKKLAFQASTGRRLAALVVSLGTNDAANAGQAAAFQANMAVFCAAWRAVFPGLVIVWIKTNPDPLGNANFQAVIDAQVAYAATDPLFRLVDNADCLLVSDHLHYTANSYLTIGQRAGSAIATSLGYPQQTIVGAPNFIGYGPIAASATNPVVLSDGDEMDGDLQVMTARLQIIASTIPVAPTGWTLVGTTASLGGGVTETLYVFTRPVTTALISANNGHMPPSTVTVVGGSTGNTARVRTLRGRTLNPTVDASAFTPSMVFGTGPVVVPALTTLSPDTRVALFTGGFCGSAGTMAEMNGILAGFAEVSDTTIGISANNVLDAMATGTLAAPGSSGTFSVTSSAGAVQANAVISFKSS